ncbi:transcriptional regulator [bacterium 336/3]|nr:transcriptional regulator [bacterium 336/3]
MITISIKEFYNEILGEKVCNNLESFLNNNFDTDIGHFNVFNIVEMYKVFKSKPVMPYNRRTYYKISLIKGKNIVEYADKVIEIENYGVLFATPRIPYRYTSLDDEQAGHFCVFTKDFMAKSKIGMNIDDLPIFKPNGDFIFQITEQQYTEIALIFEKMSVEIGSEYQFKYDLIRNYVMELIHFGQKLRPMDVMSKKNNASVRISTLFIELLERQFPIESPNQILQLRTAKDYVDVLGVHVNHLNKVLKTLTGKTTTEIITSRILQEAKILLKQTTWNVSEIAYSLGFEELAHFSNFFKKQTNLSPLSFRDN